MRYVCILLLIFAKVYPQAGSFDITFDLDGKNSSYCFPVGISNSSIDAGLQSTGKIINFRTNFAANSIFLLRYTSNGSIDTSFGVNGEVTFSTNLPFHYQVYYPTQMVIQPDDKILIMGLQQGDLYPNAYWVVRLLADGALDPSFDNDGYLDLTFGTLQDRGTCIALQPDGKILVGGTSGDTAQYFTMARLLTDGSLDTSFGIGGKVQTTFNNNQSWGNSIAVQNDGKIILGGYTENQPHAFDFGLIRYTSNGSIDTSFGTNGKVITTIDDNKSDIITKLIVQPDGKILAGGITSREINSKMAMVRYLANGALDTTFGTGGIVILTDGWSGNCSVALQVDGKYVVAGGFDGDLFEVFRYSNDGTIDTAFGTNGFVNGFPTSVGYASTVLLQPDNKLVVCGSIASPDFSQVCVAVIRLNPGVLANEAFGTTAIKVYPNPTTTMLHFDNSNSQYKSVEIYNCLGQQVAIKKLNYLNDEIIEMSTFFKGVYLLRFFGENTTAVVKVVKE